MMIAATAPPVAAQPGPAGPPAVGVIEARRQPVTEFSEFIGRVESIARVEIRARVTGFLEQRLFREGSEVAEGALLYRLERAPFEAQLEQARAQLASAEAQLANARVTLTRARELRATGAGTQVALDNAQAQERVAAAALLGAEAQVRVAEINLGYTDIGSPIAGAIGRSNFSPGNVVSPTGEALATVISQDPMRVAFTVPARTAQELRSRFQDRGGMQAMLVRIRFSDGTTYSQPGRIDFVDPAVNRDTDSILMRASVPNPVRPGMTPAEPGSRTLLDGLFVTVLLEGADPVQAITIPRAAVAQDQQGFFVFVLDSEQRAIRRNIRLGRSTPDTAVVEDGLNDGDRVVVEGVQRVRPGQPVNPGPAGAPPRPTGPAGRPG